MRFVGNVRPTEADIEKIVVQIKQRTGVTVCPDGGDAHIYGNEARRQNGPDPFDNDAIHKAMQIISLCVEPCPRGSKRIQSYGGKHTCEEHIKPISYITNGDFIVAMELCGYHSVWPKKRIRRLNAVLLGKWSAEMLELIRYRGIQFASSATAKENASGIVTVRDTTDFEVAMGTATGRGGCYFHLEAEFALSFRYGCGPTEDDVAKLAIQLKPNPKFTPVPSNRLKVIREAMQIIALCVPWCARMPRKRIQSGKGKHTCERFMSGGHVGEHEFTLAMELREILGSHARLYSVKFRGAWNKSLLALLHRRYIYYCSTKSKLLLASVIFTTRADWRPALHRTFPPCVREGIRTVLVLRKARRSGSKPCAPDCERYTQSCLPLLPEELMQYIFVYVCV